MLRSVYKSNAGRCQRPVEEVLDMGNGLVVPLTDGLICPFLRDSDRTCMIYNIRPPHCRMFGSEIDPLMSCPYLDRDGRKRGRKERRKLRKETARRVHKTHCNLKQLRG
tara:strand:- start:4739 stop:5065 length:327 start_codon:yes stop_codon:yes gene_type:complete